VLGIILIVASLYWQSTSRSQQSQQRKNCEKNLQKIFIAMEIFATDHGGKYPDVPGARTSGEALDGLVPRYTVDTGAFVCPASKDAALPAGKASARRKISYAYYMGRGHSDATEVLMSDQQVDVLAKLAGHVYSIEIVDALARRARETLDSLGIANVTIAARDGNAGWPEHAPYDAITVAAATTEVPLALVEQLAVGGRLIIPVGGDEFQTLHLIEKRANGSTDVALIDVRFVPLIWPN